MSKTWFFAFCLICWKYIFFNYLILLQYFQISWNFESIFIYIRLLLIAFFFSGDFWKLVHRKSPINSEDCWLHHFIYVNLSFDNRSRFGKYHKSSSLVHEFELSMKVSTSSHNLATEQNLRYFLKYAPSLY